MTCPSAAKKSCVSHLFGVCPGEADKTALEQELLKAITFFVLHVGPILVKFHIRTRLIESFPTFFRTWWCGEEKLHFMPVHTLRQFSNRASLETLRPSEVVETALRHASIGARCELVWSATFLGSTSKSNTLLESSRLAEFGCEISPG